MNCITRSTAKHNRERERGSGEYMSCSSYTVLSLLDETHLEREKSKCSLLEIKWRENVLEAC